MHWGALIDGVEKTYIDPLSLLDAPVIRLKPVDGRGSRRPWTLISAAYNLERAKMQLHKRFKEQGAPDVAIGFGAYVELPLHELPRGT